MYVAVEDEIECRHGLDPSIKPALSRPSDDIFGRRDISSLRVWFWGYAVRERVRGTADDSGADLEWFRNNFFYS